jgi:hypothetical protein
MAEVSAVANGAVFSARHVKAYIDQEYVVELKKIDYDDELPKTAQRNWNGVFLGVAEEAYKANCKIELGKQAFNKIMKLAKDKGVGLYGLPELTIRVDYKNDKGEKCTDEIVGVIKKNSLSVGDNEKHIGHSLEIEVTQPIRWNEVEAFKTDV